MTSEFVYPLLIAAGCGVVVAAAHVATRRRPTRDDIAVPEPHAANVGSVDPHEPDATQIGMTPDARELQAWHIAHEAAVVAFMEEVDGFADSTGARRHDALGATLDQAAAEHPAAEMRGELAGMESAARAMFDAAGRGDDDGASRHLARYEQYRDVWLDRLAQFPIDARRVAELRERARSERK